MGNNILRLIVNNENQQSFKDQIALQMNKYCRYLMVHFGLKENTIDNYRKIARSFLLWSGILYPDHSQVENYRINGGQMRYLYEGGKPRRVMHIMRFTETGEMTTEAFCGIKHKFDRSINAPWGLGRRLCKNCKHIMNRRTATERFK